ncbi:MAG: hypothetical protein HOC70_01720 [Gammaproteobacteria bacterium]|jgi:hypothetical protein|nr:hypothetical protein [Gammaproteobacteria bacterium]MBT4491933.1 hypothetical protein [Gammaproteobacteria bacterium]MBT7369485.1 hypothetical protein [Gammaproteobacteria bacterium]
MQPSVKSVIESIRFSLKHDLLPELQSDWARQQGARMLWVLDHLQTRALCEHEFAVQENEELKSLLHFAQTYFESSGHQAWPFDPRMLNDLPLKQESWPSLEELQVSNYSLRTAVDRLVESSPEEEVANKDHPLWSAILKYLTNQNAREAHLAAGDWPPTE